MTDNYGLALHTTSPQLGLALSNFTDDTRTQILNLGRDLSSHLHQTLVEFLEPQTWSDLKFIVVAKGPGSFTSTRIGVVTARTLAQQLEVPLFAISSLAAVAWSEKDKVSARRPLVVKMEARRAQVFTGIYEIPASGAGLIERLPDRVMSLEAWQHEVDTSESIAAPTDLGVTVTSLLELAYLQWQRGSRPHWSEALPFYGQHPV